MAASHDAAEQVQALRKQVEDLRGRLASGPGAGRAGAAGAGAGAAGAGAAGAGAAGSAPEGAPASAAEGSRGSGELAQALGRLADETAPLAGAAEARPRTGAASSGPAPPSLPDLNAGLGALAAALNRADAPPTAAQEAAVRAYREALDRQLAAWAAARRDVEAVNRLLRGRGLPELQLAAPSAPRGQDS